MANLEPGASLRSIGGGIAISEISCISGRQYWRHCDLRQSTVVVVAGRRGVGSSVTFTSGLDPHDGVNETGTSVGGGLSSEARS